MDNGFTIVSRSETLRYRATSPDTVASRAFSVSCPRVSPAPTAPVASILLFHGCQGSTRKPGDNGTWDVAFCQNSGYCMQGTHHLVFVACEQTSLGMLWVEARRSCCPVQRKGEDGFLNHGERGVGLRRGRLTQSGEVSSCLCPLLEVAGDDSPISGAIFSELGGPADHPARRSRLWGVAFFHQGRASVVTSFRGELFRSGSRFLLTSICGFCQRDPKVPSSHCSHIRRMSLEERLLLGLPHRSRRRRHRRSVEALVSLCEVTPDKAAERQRAQASSAAFGMCVRSGTRVEGRSMISRWGSGMDSTWGNTVSSWRR